MNQVAEIEVGASSTGWRSNTLKLAAIYNLTFGLVTILFPFLIFDLLSMPRPNYPEIWQCVGMVVGVYGIGYWIAAQDPLTHWPITLVGFLGKIFGPLGFAFALFKGTLPFKFGAILVTNDLLWWVPFFLILRDKWQRHLSLSRGES
jgi:hypothetical protein